MQQRKFHHQVSLIIYRYLFEKFAKMVFMFLMKKSMLMQESLKEILYIRCISVIPKTSKELLIVTKEAMITEPLPVALDTPPLSKKKLLIAMSAHAITLC